jgi:hypothetical protein
MMCYPTFIIGVIVGVAAVLAVQGVYVILRK